MEKRRKFTRRVQARSGADDDAAEETIRQAAKDLGINERLLEGFFGRLKRERVNRRRYLAPAEARVDVFDYIERFYNPRMRRRLAVSGRDAVGLNSTVRETGP